MNLLFTCYFEDGTFYTQNPQDVSINNPTKSCYFDILEKEKTGNNPLAFCLTRNNSDDYYLVDLRDGAFEINNTRFFLHQEDNIGPFKLIYYRTNNLYVTAGLPDSLSIRYNFGWQTNFNGENIKKIITID